MPGEFVVITSALLTYGLENKEIQSGSKEELMSCKPLPVEMLNDGDYNIVGLDIY